MCFLNRIVGLLLCSLTLLAHAGVEDLGKREATSGLKLALTRAAGVAVEQLGQPDGFLGNARVRIPLPKSLQKIEGMARMLGLAAPADELLATMNRAAESAVIEARPLLVRAVKKMSVSDAITILSGPDDAATRYFRSSASAELTRKFQPIVRATTRRLQLAEKYEDYAGRAAMLGLIKAEDASLDAYVTQKALDGLFLIIADQERQIRQDPLGTGSRLLGKVFGAIQDGRR